MNETHLFFDLDHTLWDFETNAKECLFEIYDKHLLKYDLNSKDEFIDHFSTTNRQMWAQLERKEITHEFLRANRFKIALEKLGISLNENDGNEINDLFLALLPQKKALMENTIELLDYCNKHYRLHIISNGFYDVQIKKMKNSGIHDYFDQIITNEIAGVRKPEKKIFHYAMQAAKCKVENAIMIGDSFEADVIGATKAGMKAIYFAEENKENHPFHITNLIDLKNHL